MFAHDVLESLIIYLHDCMCVRRDFGYPCFTGDRRGMNWLVDCACTIGERSVERLCLKLFKSCKEGCFSLCYALFLEDSRANCCSHRTGRNIAFAHFLFNLWKSLSKIVSVSKSHNGLRVLCLLKEAQTSSIVSFEGKVQCVVCAASLGNAFPSPTSLSPFFPSPASPIIFPETLACCFWGSSSSC